MLTRPWRNLLLLVLLLIFSSLIEKFLPTQSLLGILVLCLLWLVIGATFKSVSQDEPEEMFGTVAWRIFCGLLILSFVWLLPVWFPKLKSTDYGFTINLRESPAVIWMAVAFIIGLYKKLVSKIPVAAWNTVKTIFNHSVESSRK